MSHRFAFSNWILSGLALSLCITAAPNSVFAQAGLRESIEKLDKNNDGYIESDEVTPLARPYLERILKGRSSSDPFYRPVSIERIREAARIYYAVKNGVSGRSVYPDTDAKVKSFGPQRNETIVPEFGLAKIRFPYTQADIDETESTLRRSDRNQDGMIDRAEALRARWTHRDPFADDLNGDDRLSRMELIQRYARRRLLEGDSDELVQRARRVGSGIESSRKSNKRDDRSEWWRKGGSEYWLTASIMGRFDTNRNGRLEVAEAQQLGFRPGRVDVDGDGELTRDEMFALITQLQDEVGDMTETLPAWFFENDANRDGQIAMHEFTTEWTLRKHQEFELLDTNGDGILTAMEAAKSKTAVGGSYQNNEAQVLPTRRTLISEIEVTDDFLISDLNVQISITHSHTGHLDGYLTGPEGQRVELFTEIGGSGDHFDQTIFDDQSKIPITKAKAPFKGTYAPEAIQKKQPGLAVFNDKSVKGVWQLIIRGTRNDRFGLLHSWGLTVKPKEELPGSTLTQPMQEGEKTTDGKEAKSKEESKEEGKDKKAATPTPPAAAVVPSVPPNKSRFELNVTRRGAQPTKASPTTKATPPASVATPTKDEISSRQDFEKRKQQLEDPTGVLRQFKSLFK